MQVEILKKLGFNDRMANIYLALLSLGPSSVRKLAEKSDLNRGTVYENLKILKDWGVVDFYEKDKKQYFVAENPDKLHDLVRERSKDLEEVDRRLEKLIPELMSLHNKGDERPIAKYYNRKEIGKILVDVLETCEQGEEKTYRIYSAAPIREYLYDGFETFSDARLAKGISVKVIAIGEGGELRGMDERKWMRVENAGAPTYILIYPGKTAYISLDTKKEPIGVVVENEGIYQTQKNIFDQLWDKI